MTRRQCCEKESFSVSPLSASFAKIEVACREKANSVLQIAESFVRSRAGSSLVFSSLEPFEPDKNGFEPSSLEPRLDPALVVQKVGLKKKSGFCFSIGQPGDLKGILQFSEKQEAAISPP